MRTERFFKNHLLPFAEMRCSRGSKASFKLHMHHTFNIGAVDQGEVIYEISGGKSILAPGSLALINPETLHTCNPVAGQERGYTMLHLDIGWCFQVQQSMWEKDCFVKAEKTRIDDELLYGRFCRAMEDLMEEKIPLLEKEQILFDLVQGIFSAACSLQPVRKERRGSIEDLKRLLAEDLHKDLTLNSLAETMGLNPYTLIRRFKSLTGITPHAFRLNSRIEKARELLRQGRDITETALECGFFDQSHFHRHFKAMTTVTPREYRVNFIQ
ncbi:helix-turn-helix domain-containing protein [Desulfospira joergensenii]|uniref:helix-turn-helix domain-containing protein n=1 Tax=Desulfospira joergensenii TaxID=53329 RepID=UPI0003B54C51|nr:AraC family transcriptional regulator [Desulfospira joergensenii]